jgi:hypothetical protein
VNTTARLVFLRVLAALPSSIACRPFPLIAFTRSPFLIVLPVFPPPIVCQFLPLVASTRSASLRLRHLCRIFSFTLSRPPLFIPARHPSTLRHLRVALSSPRDMFYCTQILVSTLASSASILPRLRPRRLGLLRHCSGVVDFPLFSRFSYITS